MSFLSPRAVAGDATTCYYFGTIRQRSVMRRDLDACEHTRSRDLRPRRWGLYASLCPPADGRSWGSRSCGWTVSEGAPSTHAAVR
jgi:hypothetical protein